jgi:hypothetical protein
MSNQLPDGAVMTHIQKLTEKEQTLYLKSDLSDDDIKELHKVKAELDQYCCAMLAKIQIRPN